MKFIRSDKVHTHVVGTVGEYLARVADSRKPWKRTMRDLVASRAPRVPSIRQAFALPVGA